MKTPAQRHYEQVTAQQAAAKSAAGGVVTGSAYDLMLVKLRSDKHRLSSLQSIERKIEVKRELVPDYADYISGALAGGRGAQDDVLTTQMIWRVDVGDIAGALPIAAYALQHNMTLPDQYERKLATAFAEEVAEYALARIETDPLDVQLLLQVAKLTDPHDMHDQVRAKLYKAIGYSLQANPAEALPYLNRAVQLFQHIGVKKDIARLEKELGKPDTELEPTSTPPAAAKPNTTRQAKPPGAGKPAKLSGAGQKAKKPKPRT